MKDVYRQDKQNLPVMKGKRNLEAKGSERRCVCVFTTTKTHNAFSFAVLSMGRVGKKVTATMTERKRERVRKRQRQIEQK